MSRQVPLLDFCLLAFVLLGGCASFATTTDGGGADMGAFGLTAEQRHNAADVGVRMELDRKPLARFPTALAVARVQSPGYRSSRAQSYGRGRYSVVTGRDVETEEDFQRLARLPLVRGVAPVSRLLLPSELQSDDELRRAAGRLQADVLLIYTLDTAVDLNDASSPLDLVTLGFLPHAKASVTTSASALLMDTRNGYIYGLAEGTGRHEQMANSWTTESAMDHARAKAERQAMDDLLKSLEVTWAAVVQEYASPEAQAAAPGPSGQAVRQAQ